MSSNFSSQLGGASNTIPPPTEKPIAHLATVLLIVRLQYALATIAVSYPITPSIGMNFQFSQSRRITEFFQTSKELIIKGTAAYGDKPFELMTESSNVLVLPPSFIRKLRSDPNLAFEEPAIDNGMRLVSSYKVGQWLSLAAIHTTIDWLTQTMVDLAEYPKLFQPLRGEFSRVLGAEGFKMMALYKPKLMDSVIKESQRRKPVLLSIWRRLAKKDVIFFNGVVLRKGQKIIATNIHMSDVNYYENTAKYDGYRFLTMRDAYPGPFFAVNEIKITPAHLLLRYDWKFPEGFKPQTMPHIMVLLPDLLATLLIRRRKEELYLDSLERRSVSLPIFIC
ncbi:cytochrome P450 [Colletotrichum orchidophilum]|uniref:Cytochrome P450 n=1 Tax=Colletotrichum orchidophilum TaxID=1209926 RepID=A0A1G4B4C2_9PEZI|nr:cytochrome P450 [Colletotrichum orchidophilum]OHE96280.1 cytochrome P450 [Colletotrichum orchidophilum]